VEIHSWVQQPLHLPDLADLWTNGHLMVVSSVSCYWLNVSSFIKICPFIHEI